MLVNKAPGRKEREGISETHRKSSERLLGEEWTGEPGRWYLTLRKVLQAPGTFITWAYSNMSAHTTFMQTQADKTQHRTGEKTAGPIISQRTTGKCHRWVRKS